jgi:hypothetical protein
MERRGRCSASSGTRRAPTACPSPTPAARIKAQAGWNGSYNKTEWWHLQYKVDKQETFLDEMELIGYSEAKLRAAGWNTIKLLDNAPG